MLKLSKRADYGLIALRHLALHYGEGACSAADIAEAYEIPAHLMAKVLQRLARKRLVTARHGATGGYTLARPPGEITALEAISAIDGPLQITSCSTHHGECVQSAMCTIREPLRRVNETILNVLNGLTISQMTTEGRVPSAMVELRP
jgi:Rrf2 family protein